MKYLETNSCSLGITNDAGLSTAIESVGTAQQPLPLLTMKLKSLPCSRLAIVALALVLVASAYGAAEDVIKKTFDAVPGGQLVLDVDRGSIEISPSTSGGCEIQVTRKAKNQKTLDEHDITFAKDGEKISVGAKSKSSGSWFGQSFQVAYVITVPQKFDVDLRTAGGSVRVTGLNGKVKAHTSGGSMRFEQLEGSLNATTSGGSVNVAGCQGAVEVKTSGGSLKLANITGDVSARTSGGSISCSQLIGKSVVHTSGGSVNVSGIKGQIEAATSGGSIEASLEGQPSGECSFKTAGGSVSVALAEDITADVDAKTSAGRVSSDFSVNPPQDPKNKGELQGKINGGGPLIIAKTSGGSIRIKKYAGAK